MARIGFLGMGIMGSPMAANLLASGYEVVVWNRSADKCTVVMDKGATRGESPKDVVLQCDVVIGMVSDPEAAIQVALGEGGVCEGIKESNGSNGNAKKGYIDMSTVDAETASRIGEEIHAAGGRFLEAPVSGSKKPAEDGTLIIMTAGDETLFEESKAALDVMGKKSYYLGTKVGLAANAKLIVNMIMGTMMTSLGEGMAMAEHCALDQKILLEILSLGAIANPMFSLKGNNILNDNYATNFPLKHEEKDMRLAVELAESQGLQVSVAGAARESFRKAKEDMDLGEEDFAAVAKLMMTSAKIAK